MKIFKNEKFNRIPWVAIVIAFVAIVAVILSAVVQRQSNQAADGIVPDVVFEGRYRISGGEWQPVSDGIHISSTQGNVELKGVFKLYYAPTGEDLGSVEQGTTLSIYLDHIKATIKDAGGNVWESDNENALMEKGLCSEMWTQYKFYGESGDEVLITFYNPHVYGNERAIDSFLEKLCIYNASSGGVIDYIGVLPLVVGIIIAISMLVLLAAAIFATMLRQRNSRELWLLWLLVIFGGMYFVFSRDKISIWNPMYAFNTMVLGAAMMLYVLTAYAIIASILSGALRKIAIGVTAALGATALGAMTSALIPTVKLYNSYPYWATVAVLGAVILTVCIVISLIRRDKTEGSIDKKIVFIPSIAALIAFIADAVATLTGVWQGGMLSMLVLFAIVIASAVTVVRVVPKSIKAVLDAKSIEAEKQAMEKKLQESHISIMLSQIQPHFLYNTLNSIYHLCETNPMRARSMVNSFSEYLRNNLSSLEEAKLISFETELSHINTYLDIERVRFEDTLEIEYDIKCTDFYLPVLTVQPIVENAVKHGTSKKRGGGRVIISTDADKDFYIIKVSDTGCGFDPAKPKNDGKRHVGIENVRQRLANMCDGSLTIESEIGVGTVATVKIPKGGKK